MGYEHTQQGRMYLFTAAVISLVVVVFAASLADSSALVPIIVVGVVAVGLAWGLSRLKVSVDSTEVHTAFGPGWPRRTIALADIRSVEPVRNRWYHGWGIRKVARGWMFNVWGLDAVELQLSSGKVFRIGTDEPLALADAIDARLPG